MGDELVLNLSTTPTVSGMDPEIESRLKRAAVRSNRAREDLLLTIRARCLSISTRDNNVTGEHT